MAYIKTEKEYAAVMSRIDQLIFETTDDTPVDDPRMKELDVLSAQAEEYEKEVWPIVQSARSQLFPKWKQLKVLEN